MLCSLFAEFISLRQTLKHILCLKKSAPYAQEEPNEKTFFLMLWSNNGVEQQNSLQCDLSKEMKAAWHASNLPLCDSVRPHDEFKTHKRMLKNQCAFTHGHTLKLKTDNPRVPSFGFGNTAEAASSLTLFLRYHTTKLPKQNTKVRKLPYLVPLLRPPQTHWAAGLVRTPSLSPLLIDNRVRGAGDIFQ